MSETEHKKMKNTHNKMVNIQHHMHICFHENISLKYDLLQRIEL